MHSLQRGDARVLKQYPRVSPQSNPRVLHQRSLERRHCNREEAKSGSREEIIMDSHVLSALDFEPSVLAGIVCAGDHFRLMKTGKTMGRAVSLRSLYYKR